MMNSIRETKLHRNKACLNCRTRKTKCDAIKPICSACSKLKQHHLHLHHPNHHPHPHLICQYDSNPDWLQSVLRSKPSEQQRVVELEQRLNQLQQRLDSLSHNKKNCHTSFIHTPPPLLSSPTPSIPDLVHSSTPPPPPPPPPPSILPIISEPNWLIHLPPRHTCKLLLKAFFSRPLSPFTLVDPVSLQSRIDLSCADPHFPEPALIHAVCAIGSQYLHLDQDLIPTYWSPPSDPPHLHHARWAEQLLNDGILSCHQHYHPNFEPSKLIQLSEAAVLCCQYYTLVGKPLMIWKSLGYSTRLATLLGLHTPFYAPNLDSTRHQSLSSSNSSDDLVSLWPDGVGLFENTPDHRIQHYRTVLWWYVFCCDKMCAAAGGFASTIDEKDSLIPIYSPSPTTSASSIPPLNPNLIMSSDQILFNNIQHPTSFYLPKSPGFFFYHQIGDFDSLQLLIKAAILLGRVNTSLYRRSHPAKSTGQINQEYEELSSLIWGLFNSIPVCLKNPFRFNQAGHLDSCLLSAHALIHTALIQLNEDLVELNAGNPDKNQEDDDDKEQHLRMCKESGKVLVEWFLELIRWKNSGLIQVDLGVLLCGNPALNFSLSVALRTHCRFIAIHKYKASLSKSSNKSQLLHLDQLQLQINLILTHLKESQKMPLEGRIVELITFLLNSPWTLLPKKKNQSSSLLSTTTAIVNRKKSNQVVKFNLENFNFSSNQHPNYFNPNKKTKTGFKEPLSDHTGPKFGSDNEYHYYRSKYNPSTETHDFHSMVSNFALAKLLNPQT